MATATWGEKHVDMTTVGIFKSAKPAFLNDVVEDYNRHENENFTYEGIVLDLIRKHDLLPKGIESPSEVASWLFEVTGEGHEVPDLERYNKDVDSTIPLERSTRDALRRKVGEFGYDYGWEGERNSEALYELARVHELLKPYAVTAREFKDWRSDLESD